MHANRGPTRASDQRHEAQPANIAAEAITLNLERLFHPTVALAAALLGAVLFAGASYLLFEGDRLRHYLFYNVPIAAPFILFLFERARFYLRTRPRAAASVALDSVVVSVALARAIFPLPFVSGHALFLTYALMTVRSRMAKLTAVLVLLIVIYFKAFVWHDPSLLGGATVGIAAGLAWKRLNR